MRTSLLPRPPKTLSAITLTIILLLAWMISPARASLTTPTIKLVLGPATPTIEFFNLASAYLTGSEAWNAGISASDSNLPIPVTGDIPLNAILYGGEYATPEDRKVYALVDIKSPTNGANGATYLLSNSIIFMAYGFETNAVPPNIKDFQHMTYDTLGNRGINPGIDNILGTADDVFATDSTIEVRQLQIMSVSYGIDRRNFTGSKEEVEAQANALVSGGVTFSVEIYEHSPPVYSPSFPPVEYFSASGSASASFVAVPEPSAYGLMTIGLLSFAVWRRRKRETKLIH